MKAITLPVWIIASCGLMIPFICLADDNGNHSAGDHGTTGSAPSVESGTRSSGDRSTAAQSPDTRPNKSDSNSNDHNPRLSDGNTLLPDTHVHSGPKTSGKVTTKPVANQLPSKTSGTSEVTGSNAQKVPSAPMAAAEAASTQKNMHPPKVLATAGASFSEKRAADFREAKPKENVTGGIIFEKPAKPILSQPTGTSLNGSLSGLSRNKTPSLAVVNGSNLPRTSKGAAIISGTGIR